MEEKHFERGKYIEMVFAARRIIKELHGMGKDYALGTLAAVYDVINESEKDSVPEILQRDPMMIFELACQEWERHIKEEQE